MEIQPLNIYEQLDVQGSEVGTANNSDERNGSSDRGDAGAEAGFVSASLAVSTW